MHVCENARRIQGIQGSAVSDSFGNTTAVVIGAPAAGASEKNLGGANPNSKPQDGTEEPELAQNLRLKLEVALNMITVYHSISCYFLLT